MATMEYEGLLRERAVRAKRSLTVITSSRSLTLRPLNRSRMEIEQEQEMETRFPLASTNSRLSTKFPKTRSRPEEHRPVQTTYAHTRIQETPTERWSYSPR